MENKHTMNSNNNIQANKTDTTTLYYHGDKFSTKIPQSFIKENLRNILSEKNIDKYFNNNDIERLAEHLPPDIQKAEVTEKKAFIKQVFSAENQYSNQKFKFINPLKTFENMVEKKYFTEDYQNYLQTFTDVEALEEYLGIMKLRFDKLKENIDKYTTIFSRRKKEFGELTEDENSEAGDRTEENFIYTNVVFDMHSELASSGYTTINSDGEGDGPVDNLEQQMSITQSDGVTEKTKENEAMNDGVLSDERFKNLKMNKNQLTIQPRTKTEIMDYHAQELERYKSPHLPWTYYNQDGTTSVVAPVLKKLPSSSSSKPRDHIMLKSDRPSYVTILCLARDAASRLPEGVGTRADICDLLKDSQYINERLSDSQINNIVSGALDRLHYEKDPCVKYDLQKKLWIYLHKNRTVDYPPWNEHLKKSEKDSNVNQADIEINLDEKGGDVDNSSISNINNTGNIQNTSSKKKSKKIDKEKMLNKKRKGSSLNATENR